MCAMMPMFLIFSVSSCSIPFTNLASFSAMDSKRIWLLPTRLEDVNNVSLFKAWKCISYVCCWQQDHKMMLISLNNLRKTSESVKFWQVDLHADLFTSGCHQTLADSAETEPILGHLAHRVVSDGCWSFRDLPFRDPYT